MVVCTVEVKNTVLFHMHIICMRGCYPESKVHKVL